MAVEGTKEYSMLSKLFLKSRIVLSRKLALEILNLILQSLLLDWW